MNNSTLKIKGKKIYIPTIDKKIICIEKWFLKNKIKSNIKLKLS